MLIPRRDEFLPKVKKVLMFKYFSADAVQDFYERSEILSFKEGEPIIVEGDKSPYFYSVLSGNVNVTVSDSSKEVFISLVGEGESFGEAGIFMNVKRTANVVSATDTVLLRIHRSALLQLIKERPSDGVKFLMIVIYTLLKKLRDANLELAFERKSDIEQDEIDAMVHEIMTEK